MKINFHVTIEVIVEIAVDVRPNTGRVGFVMDAAVLSPQPVLFGTRESIDV